MRECDLQPEDFRVKPLGFPEIARLQSKVAQARHHVLGARRYREGMKSPPGYSIFQVSPEVSSFAMSPGPRSEIARCSCSIIMSS
jgi:hypothetical protein